MERTNACTSFNLDFSAMFLSLQIGLSFANAVDIGAGLQRISVLDPSSLVMAPRYLNWFTASSSCLLAVMHDLIVLLLFVNILVFSALISIPYMADVSSNPKVGDGVSPNVNCTGVVFQCICQQCR